ncbi:MAG: ABC transporter substrate-binding protein [Solirubrobacterales bacterium]
MRFVLLAIVVAAALLALAGCGDDDEGTGGANGEEVTQINVGVLPISDVAPLYVGIEQGFFRDQGLEVKPRIVQGGAEVVTGVVSGDFEFGFAATEPIILAKAEGLPLKIVTTGNQAAEDPKQAWTGLMVKEDGPIDEPADLEGRTIAVNALQSTPQLATLSMLDEAGVNIDSLEFIEAPFPDMPAALDAGRVDAVTAAEPFLPQIRAAGGTSLGDYFYELEPGMTIGTYFTTDQRIGEDPELIESFATAMNESLEYAQANEEQARAAIGTFTEIPPPVLKEIALPPWSSDLRRPTIQLMADQALKYGFIEEPVEADSIIWEGATG